MSNTFTMRENLMGNVMVTHWLDDNTDTCTFSDDMSYDLDTFVRGTAFFTRTYIEKKAKETLEALGRETGANKVSSGTEKLSANKAREQIANDIRAIVNTMMSKLFQKVIYDTYTFVSGSDKYDDEITLYTGRMAKKHNRAQTGEDESEEQGKNANSNAQSNVFDGQYIQITLTDDAAILQPTPSGDSITLLDVIRNTHGSIVFVQDFLHNMTDMILRGLWGHPELFKLALRYNLDISEILDDALIEGYQIFFFHLNKEIAALKKVLRSWVVYDDKTIFIHRLKQFIRRASLLDNEAAEMLDFSVLDDNEDEQSKLIVNFLLTYVYSLGLLYRGLNEGSIDNVVNKKNHRIRALYSQYQDDIRNVVDMLSEYVSNLYDNERLSTEAAYALNILSLTSYNYIDNDKLPDLNKTPVLREFLDNHLLTLRTKAVHIVSELLYVFGDIAYTFTENFIPHNDLYSTSLLLEHHSGYDADVDTETDWVLTQIQTRYHQTLSAMQINHVYARMTEGQTATDHLYHFPKSVQFVCHNIISTLTEQIQAQQRPDFNNTIKAVGEIKTSALLLPMLLNYFVMLSRFDAQHPSYQLAFNGIVYVIECMKEASELLKRIDVGVLENAHVLDHEIKQLEDLLNKMGIPPSASQTFLSEIKQWIPVLLLNSRYTLNDFISMLSVAFASSAAIQAYRASNAFYSNNPIEDFIQLYSQTLSEPQPFNNTSKTVYDKNILGTQKLDNDDNKINDDINGGNSGNQPGRTQTEEKMLDFLRQLSSLYSFIAKEARVARSYNNTPDNAHSWHTINGLHTSELKMLALPIMLQTIEDGKHITLIPNQDSAKHNWIHSRDTRHTGLTWDDLDALSTTTTDNFREERHQFISETMIPFNHNNLNAFIVRLIDYVTRNAKSGGVDITKWGNETNGLTQYAHRIISTNILWLVNYLLLLGKQGGFYSIIAQTDYPSLRTKELAYAFLSRIDPTGLIYHDNPFVSKMPDWIFNFMSTLQLDEAKIDAMMEQMVFTPYIEIGSDEQVIGVTEETKNAARERLRIAAQIMKKPQSSTLSTSLWENVTSTTIALDGKITELCAIWKNLIYDGISVVYERDICCLNQENARFIIKRASANGNLVELLTRDPGSQYVQDTNFIEASYKQYMTLFKTLQLFPDFLDRLKDIVSPDLRDYLDVLYALYMRPQCINEIYNQPNNKPLTPELIKAECTSDDGEQKPRVLTFPDYKRIIERNPMMSLTISAAAMFFDVILHDISLTDYNNSLNRSSLFHSALALNNIHDNAIASRAPISFRILIAPETLTDIRANLINGSNTHAKKKGQTALEHALIHGQQSDQQNRESIVSRDNSYFRRLVTLPSPRSQQKESDIHLLNMEIDENSKVASLAKLSQNNWLTVPAKIRHSLLNLISFGALFDSGSNDYIRHAFLEMHRERYDIMVDYELTHIKHLLEESVPATTYETEFQRRVLQTIETMQDISKILQHSNNAAENTYRITTALLGKFYYSQMPQELEGRLADTSDAIEFERVSNAAISDTLFQINRTIHTLIADGLDKEQIFQGTLSLYAQHFSPSDTNTTYNQSDSNQPDTTTLSGITQIYELARQLNALFTYAFSSLMSYKLFELRAVHETESQDAQPHKASSYLRQVKTAINKFNENSVDVQNILETDQNPVGTLLKTAFESSAASFLVALLSDEAISEQTDLSNALELMKAFSHTSQNLLDEHALNILQQYFTNHSNRSLAEFLAQGFF